jgi:dipeptidyl aminopeptidase/acylaminoacyl peptidase
MPRFATCAALLLCLPLSAAAGDKRRPLTVEDVMRIRHIPAVALAPDGQSVAYVVSVADLKQGRYNTDVWLAPARGGAPLRLTRAPGRDDSPRWAPDSETLGFLSDRDGKPQVWLIRATGGEAWKLTDSKTGVRDFAWSPDGKAIAYLAAEPDSEADAKRKQEKADFRVVEHDRKLDHLHLISGAGGASKRLTAGAFCVLNFDWSPDSRQLVYAAAPSRGLEDLYHSDLYVTGTDPGKPRPLVKRQGMDTLPKWSPDGKSIAFVSGDGKLDWLDNSYLCVVPAAGGDPRNVSKKFDGRISPAGGSYAWTADSTGLCFLGDEQATRQLFLLSVRSGELGRLTSGERFHGHFDLRGEFLAFLSENPQTPPEVCLAPLGHSATDLDSDPPRRPSLKQQRLTATNPQLKDVALGKVETFRWKGADGVPIEGLLIKPADYEKGKRYPLLTYVHGGPALQFAHAFSVYPQGPPQASRYPVHVLAGQGYVIFCPNPRGSDGYGKKFRQLNVKDWGGGDFKDVMAGVDELIEQGLADKDRLGIMGWSYGGYMTSWAITQTDRFKAASAGAGVTNLFSMYGQTDIPAFMERYFGGLPWQERELYAKHSAMTYAGKIRTPTLIQHGEKDERVPLAQSQELHAALKRNGVPCEFVIYPRSPHNPTEPQLQRDVLQRNVDWFNRWLKKP